jgi:ABC-type multidrug transport system fused ATPase/permease subunit
VTDSGICFPRFTAGFLQRQDAIVNFTGLKKLLQDISAILDRREKTALWRLILFDVIISVLDIAFLVILLYIVHFYTEVHPTPAKPHSLFSLYERSPLVMMGVFFALFALKNLAGFLVLRLQFRFVYGVASRLSEGNLVQYLDGDLYQYVQVNSSVHMRKINQQPIEFGHYVLGGLQQIVSQSLLILITVMATLLFSPVLFLLLFVILTPPIILTGFLIKRKMSATRKMAKPFSEKSLQYLQESLSGFIESNIYNSKGFFIERYAAYQGKFNEFLGQQQVIQNIPSRLIEVFAIFGFFVLILINSYTGNTNTIQLITIGAFMGAAYKIIPGVVKILNSLGQIRTYGFTVTELAGDLAGEPAGRRDVLRAGEEAAVQTGGRVPRPAGIGSVGFSDVTFRYEDKPVLKDLSFQLERGECIGLSGMSGKGKTTVVNLLLGFSEPCRGVISINGNSTQAEERREYWQHVAYVKQQPFMINDSILRNIVLAEKATDPERLDQVIRAVGLDGVKGVFPEGLDTILTENGRNISGGQRQRIAFARALYKQADLLILDEPFNELDEASEREMLRHCRALAQAGKTILLITHNKESFSFCHKIISLDEPSS